MEECFHIRLGLDRICEPDCFLCIFYNLYALRTSSAAING
jgi:hypothetical protein